MIRRSDNPIRMRFEDISDALELFTERLGFRVDMVLPADWPSVAVISGHGVEIRLEGKPEPTAVAGLVLPIEMPDENERRLNGKIQNGPIVRLQPPAIAVGSDRNARKWTAGRAGMHYRDLIPGRMQGRLIASHIRIPNAGPVADYVHYHKIDLQLIYCLQGSIRVVYEDQGPPFWLKPGDCVLQPPEIRHRVLEAEANSEVVEVGSPAVHETWADHDMELPTELVKPNREFGGQRFVHHIAPDAIWNETDIDGFAARDVGIFAATGGKAGVRVLRSMKDGVLPANHANVREAVFYFVLKGDAVSFSGDGGVTKFASGDSLVFVSDEKYRFKVSAGCELLCVDI